LARDPQIRGVVAVNTPIRHTAVLTLALMLWAAAFPCSPPTLAPGGTSAPEAHVAHHGSESRTSDRAEAPAQHPDDPMRLSAPCTCGCDRRGAGSAPAGSRLGVALPASSPAPITAYALAWLALFTPALPYAPIPTGDPVPV
jgi:hypothetical protein